MYQRLNGVLDLLVSRGSLTVEEIAEHFAVSAATVRRDLDDLAAQQLVSRTRGGAIAQSVSYELPYASDPATLTVVTNALNIANELTVRPHVKIVVVGGVARPRSYELIGPLANRFVDGLNLDVMVLGSTRSPAVRSGPGHGDSRAVGCIQSISA